MGTGPTPEWGVARLSLELDESSHSCNSIIFSLSGSPSLTLCLAGFGSIPAQSRRTAKRRVVAAVITRFVINHLVTVIWGNFSRAQSPAVCSSVLDLLRPRTPRTPRTPLVALSPTVPAVSSTARQSTSRESGFLAFPSSDGPKLSNVASRQQFVRALLEDCSFFAHLVLRCVRAARGSPHSCAKQEFAKPGSNSRPTAAMQSKAQPISNSLAQRSRRNAPALEAEPLSPQTLWVDMACRHVRTSCSPEGIS